MPVPPANRRRRWHRLYLPLQALLVSMLWLTQVWGTAAARAGTDTPRIAIIIDDIGYHLTTGTRAAKFPGRLTLSVLPHSPNGSTLAQLGHSRGKEIMLHAPMTSIRDLPLDRGALTGNMDQLAFTATLADNINAVPHISGVNNHMGSRLTQEAEPMGWLMQTLKRRRLYFVDSRTSPESLAFEIARAHRLPSLRRDVFLDHRRDPDHISAQFNRLVALARSRGSALGIGHPYTETLDVLSRELADPAQLGIELVPVSALIPPHLTRKPEPPPVKIRHYR